ncbi:MAG: RNA polymerase-associated protein RapA [Pseudomonadota bacterium]
MDDFIPGQRWVNYAELQLGLGTVLSVEPRTVTLIFLASGETRTYSRQTAPLTRVHFAAGDRIRTHEGWSLKVEQVTEQNGLLTYTGSNDAGDTVDLPEGQLDSHVQLNRPAERLFTGQVDQDRWFELRYQTLQHLNRLAHSGLRGLTGGRTSLIPHQLYIAHEVANRHAPRVLLADEVGLGKTIEAGLILHQQLLTERAQRVLIVVPESLLHQWLVEMLRRFNLKFSIFDEERCDAIIESTGQDNPFHTEQQVLCTLEFLLARPEHHQQAIAGDWDLLVVDEAHHLQWSPDRVSPEYELIEQLARATRGVLLLTATPEQLGKESHFARLRLLDPDRFPDFDTFVQEEDAYEPVARAVQALLAEQPLDTRSVETLRTLMNDVEDQRLLECVQDAETGVEQQSGARTQLVDQLLDRHGTGRVLFRNTRSAVKGFPRRTLKSYPLPVPQAYSEARASMQSGTATDPQLLLCPELLYPSIAGNEHTRWTQLDPRVDWLYHQLRALRPHKVLVIAASADTAMDLAEWLHSKKGLHAAVFHEGMNIIERDRAAAYFADLEFGTQVLICSEIGSEGRNFQFAHHLVLFDLPLNPDLLEQRIGRLDRIGQLETIQIHVPYLEDTAQGVMLQWYHEGLDAFEHVCPAGQTVFTDVKSQLLDVLYRQANPVALIETTRTQHAALNAALHRGRDRLLEYNSCRPHIANALKKQIETQDHDPQLFSYLEQLVDCYNLDLEPHSNGSHILRPGEHMHSHFPGLRDDGTTFTCDRAIALANEDRDFLGWEHPLVTAAMEMVFVNETGNTAMTTIKYKGVSAGTLLLECLFTLDTVASDVLQTSRYLPPTTIRIVADQYGKDHSEALTHGQIMTTRQAIAPETALRIIRTYSQQLRDLLETCETFANRQAPEIITTAHDHSTRALTKEVNRLKALARVNPNVRVEEIEFMELQREALAAALDAATLRLDALRVVVAT